MIQALENIQILLTSQQVLKPNFYGDMKKLLPQILLYFRITVPSTPQNLQHKLISTDETLLTCDSCHGATNYIFNITSDGNQIDERITTLQQYRFKYKGNCTKFQVQIKAQNSAGSSGYSQPLEFKQSRMIYYFKIIWFSWHIRFVMLLFIIVIYFFKLRIK